MNGLGITFLDPWWFVGLVFLPVVALGSRKSLAGLGRTRMTIAIIARSLVFALLLAALAQVQWVGEANQICTLFVLDQSQSIPNDQSQKSLELVSDQIRRRPRDGDLSGLVVFGKRPSIELPPALYPREQRIRSVTSSLDRQYSDIGAALQLALGSFPPNTTGRMVLITDGNQNRGNALAEAAVAARNGVPIDVIPIEYRYESEILVDRVTVPPELRQGDTANLKVVIRSGRPATGVLRLSRIIDGSRRVLAEQRIELKAGLNVQFVRQTVDQASFSNYEATFEPDAGSFDTVARNNTATGFTWVRGEGRVLVVTSQPTVHERLTQSLSADKVAVVVRRPEDLSEDMAELAAFDAVVLINVPAESLGEKRQQGLATSVRALGTGLLMVGGPDSFGPGGYNGSPLEEALPVEMEVKATKITSKGALVLIMHACEMPEGNFWQKKVAQLAVKQLTSDDECGLLYWNGTSSWSFKLQPVKDRSLMNSRIDRMVPGDMPDFSGTMQMAFDALKTSDALTKHVIVISDGDPAPPTDQLLGMFKQSKITVTTVAIAAHGAFEERVMNRIAMFTGGRYYRVTSPKALPEIYTKETRTVGRPLIFERSEAWRPRVDFGGEPVAGLAGRQDLPGIRGFVLTTPKKTAVVEMSSPLPAEVANNPLVAHWQYGLGRAVAVTTDAGERWAADWASSDLYGKFWSQLIRWTMRPQESEVLTVSSQEKDGKVRVVANATTASGEFLNGLSIESSLVTPSGTSQTLPFKQTAPGKYEAEYSAEDAGTYMVRVASSTGEGNRELAFAPHSVSYPPEFRETQSRRELCESIALVAGGKMVDADRAGGVSFFEEPERPARRLHDAWPEALLAALLIFWIDVAVRRISVDPAEIARFVSRTWQRWRGQDIAPVAATLDRLKSVKSEVTQELRQRRYVPKEEAKSPLADPLPKQPGEAAPAPSQAKKPDIEKPATEGEDQGSHTARLLRAKKQVWEDRDKKKEEPG